MGKGFPEERWRPKPLGAPETTEIAAGSGEEPGAGGSGSPCMCTGIGSTTLLPLQLFTDGITNKLVACYTDEGMADAVLVRVYGRKTELFVDRETELRNFQVLRAHGCAPDLYCAFQNGLCYQFLPGIALGPDHVRDPHIFRLVAQEMARVHAIHANGSLPKPILWQKLHKYLTLVKTELSPKQDVPSLEMLEHELAWMKETLSQLGSPVVLCHNDLLCKNIIYDGTQGSWQQLCTPDRGVCPSPTSPGAGSSISSPSYSPCLCLRRARSLHRLRVHRLQLPGFRHWKPL
uniref:ethanolamine kinase n=1 Tax=Buteo japonicus TaxID=224669 RepID=A0A8C0APK0_9AVES